jgi:hypothetical protein
VDQDHGGEPWRCGTCAVREGASKAYKRDEKLRAHLKDYHRMPADQSWSAIPCTRPGCHTNPGGRFFLSENDLKVHHQLHDVELSAEVLATDSIRGEYFSNFALRYVFNLKSAIENFASGTLLGISEESDSCTKRPQQGLPEPGPAAGKSRRRTVGNSLLNYFLVYANNSELTDIF